MAQLKRYNGTSWETVGGVVTGDTLPIGSELDYNGASAPAGWEEIDDPNTYSTTETRIGTWIDGKPLYRKVFTITNPQSTNTNYEDVSNLNIQTQAHLYGYYKTSSGNKFDIPFYDSESNYSVIFLGDANYIRGRFGNPSIITDIKVILEYTKTTD